MKVVLSNLISNSLKFTERGSVSVALSKHNSEIITSVKDSGRGVLNADIPFIFDRFFQGRNSNGTKGTGLGLTIAKMWVEAHGGRIWAESEGEGKGTTVTFTVPVGHV